MHRILAFSSCGSFHVLRNAYRVARHAPRTIVTLGRKYAAWDSFYSVTRHFPFNTSGRYTKMPVGITRTLSLRMDVAPTIACSVTVYHW
jgi:hypothetical protein